MGREKASSNYIQGTKNCSLGLIYTVCFIQTFSRANCLRSDLLYTSKSFAQQKINK